MKFLNIQAFEKHLDETFAIGFSSLYGVALSDAFERQFIIDRILEKLQADSLHMRVSETPLSTFLSELSTQSLFASKRVFIYDEVDKLKNEGVIQKELENLPEDVYVIVAGRSLPFYEHLKKEMIFLDLSMEKPWERLSRLKRWMLQEIQKGGKTLAADAATYLFEFCKSNFETLIQELQKLIAYVGDAPQIDLQAVEAIGTLQVSEKSWQLSEAIIWGGDIHYPTLYRLQPQELHCFFGQLRYQLELGLFVSSCLERKEEGIIQEKYPKLSPKLLARYRSLVEAFSISYFKRGLKDLFELEIRVRMKSSNFLLLIDRFIAGLKRGAIHV